jgi:hypothetical protein
VWKAGKEAFLGCVFFWPLYGIEAPTFNVPEEKRTKETKKSQRGCLSSTKNLVLEGNRQGFFPYKSSHVGLRRFIGSFVKIAGENLFPVWADWIVIFSSTSNKNGLY